MFKKLLCLHLNWYEGRPIDCKSPDKYWDYTNKNKHVLQVPWTCIKCNKTKHFDYNNPPIQYKGKYYG